ncbi:Transmembrane protein 64 [Papilio xuthus]|uniref:Transmembrane protein 64 n=1 Tax=Papilio xuthus TaxID=66420 RepID=A0A194PWP4_PAPXU|nr:Transmembrane protein 64 [Papilio xuthus]
MELVDIEECQPEGTGVSRKKMSFPVTIGYLVLIITSGYLFGIVKGLGTVVVSANFGVAVAHFTLKMLRGYLPLDRLLKNETARALLKVISGPQAFKIVFFARLTPIPFGVQNTIFAVSEVGGCSYHVATLLGLLPAQVINVYLGSTLRSMHDVLHESHLTGYIVFAFQLESFGANDVLSLQKSSVRMINTNRDNANGVGGAESPQGINHRYNGGGTVERHALEFWQFLDQLALGPGHGTRHYLGEDQLVHGPRVHSHLLL